MRIASNEMELVDFRLFEENKNGETYEGVYGINVAKVKMKLSLILKGSLKLRVALIIRLVCLICVGIFCPLLI